MIVIIESPYAGRKAAHRIRNRNYTIAAMLDSISRGEAPFAGHLLYTQVLNDLDPRSRELGMRLSRAFFYHASLVAVYADLGITHGMQVGIDLALRFGTKLDYRTISWKEDANSH